MLKIITSLILLFSFLIAGATEKPSMVICNSITTITNSMENNSAGEKLRFAAYITSATHLKSATLSGAYLTDIKNLTADTKYKPRNARYINYDRYAELQDGVCRFFIVLPKELDQKAKGFYFNGYVQMLCQEGQVKPTVPMACFIK